MAGVTGAPGPRGEEGLRGKQGRGNVEVFVLHSFNSTVPQCPQTTHKLWEGFSKGPNVDGGRGVAISDPGSCVQRFSVLQTLSSLGANFAPGFGPMYSNWHIARDVEGVQEGKEVDPSAAEQFVARCSVCGAEASMLAVHSGSTQLPPCPDAWESMWTGFTYVVGTVSNYQHSTVPTVVKAPFR